MTFKRRSGETQTLGQRSGLCINNIVFWAKFKKNVFGDNVFLVRFCGLSLYLLAFCVKVDSATRWVGGG